MRLEQGNQGHPIDGAIGQVASRHVDSGEFVVEIVGGAAGDFPHRRFDGGEIEVAQDDNCGDDGCYLDFYRFAGLDFCHETGFVIIKRWEAQPRIHCGNAMPQQIRTHPRIQAKVRAGPAFSGTHFGLNTKSSDMTTLNQG